MDLTIVDFELFKVAPRWVFLKVSTACGIDGWGEPCLEGFAECVIETASNMMRDSVVGEQADEQAYITAKLMRQKFYGTTGGPVLSSAIAGIDQALMDINGKALGVPCHRLSAARSEIGSRSTDGLEATTTSLKMQLQRRRASSKHQTLSSLR